MEVCLDGVWSAIAAYSWSFEDAIVTCKQLGFPSECELKYTLCSKSILMIRYMYRPMQGQYLYVMHTLGEEMLPYWLEISIAVELRIISQIAHTSQYLLVIISVIIPGMM